MNPLIDIKTNITNNRKEFEHEQAEFTKFKSTVEPILKRLKADPANQQGFFTKFIYTPPPAAKNLLDAVAKLELMEQYEVKLTLLQQEINAFKPEDGPLELVQLSRRFESILASILECRIQAVASIIRCDATATAALTPLRNQYDQEIKAIRDKLDELDKLYREVNDDVTGKFGFKAEPEEDQSNRMKILQDLLRKDKLDFKEVFKKQWTDVTKIRAKLREAKSFKDLESLKLDLKVAEQEYDKAVLAYFSPKRGDIHVRALMDEIEADMAARGKEIRAAGRSIGTWETKQWGLLLMPTDKKEALANFVGQGFAATLNKLKARKREIKRELVHLNPTKDTIKNLSIEIKQLERDLVVPMNRKAEIENEMAVLNKQKISKKRELVGNQPSGKSAVYVEIDRTPQEIEDINAKYKVLETELNKIKVDTSKPDGRLKEAQEQLRKLEKKLEPFKAMEAELQEINRTLYHCILTRSIDVIADKEFQIRHANLDTAKKSALEYDLLKLNTKFQSTLAKYRELKDQTRSLRAGLTEEARNALLSVITIGFFNGKIDTAEELAVKKRYADLGYSMMNYLPQWLEMTKIPVGKTASSYMLDEVYKFYAWAQKHPEKASFMAGDMALTVMLITNNNDNEIDHLNKQLTARSYAMALVAPLGKPAWEEVDQENELKFRALADFSRYAPPMAAAGTNVVRQIFTGNINPANLLFEAWKGGARATLIQKIDERVDSDYVEVANAVTTILAGNSYSAALATQQNIELLRLASIARQSIRHPSTFAEAAIRNVRVWWHTMTKAPLTEILARATVQVVIPSAIAAGGLAFLGVAILGGPAVWFTAVGWAFACFFFSGTILWRGSSLMNALFHESYKKAFEEVTAAQRKNVRERFVKQQGDKIKEMRDNYILELQAARQLPIIVPPKNLKLTPEQTASAFTIADRLKEGVLDKLKVPTTAAPIDFFKANYNVEGMIDEALKLIQADPVMKHMRLADQENAVGMIIHKVTDELKVEWLEPMIEEQLVEKAVDAIEADIELKPDLTIPTPGRVLETELLKLGHSTATAKAAMPAVQDAIDDNGLRSIPLDSEGVRNRWLSRRRRRQRAPQDDVDF